MIPHPIPYQGSKRHLAQQIMRYFPDAIDRLIEPFAGSAALSIAAASHHRAQRYVLNDINPALISLWDAIINEPEHLARYYEKLWLMQQGRERSFYDSVRTRFNQTKKPHYFLYLLARCVKASVRYNAQGEFNQSPDNRRKGRHPKSMRRDILAAAALFQANAMLSAVDYREVLQIATTDDLVYLDPPYQGVCATSDPRYFKGIGVDDLIAGLSELNQRHIRYILSYDGRTGNKAFGQALPGDLHLKHIELNAGRSSQATLLGKNATTYESLYLSPALVDTLGSLAEKPVAELSVQLSLFRDTQ